MGGPEHPGRRGLEVKVSRGAVGFGQESDGDILVLKRVTQGPQRLPPATGQSRRELGVPAEPCAKPSQSCGRCFPLGWCGACLHPSPASFPPSVAAAGMCRQQRGKSCQEVRVSSWVPSQGPIPGSHPSFPTALGPWAGSEGADGCWELSGSLWSQRAPLIL